MSSDEYGFPKELLASDVDEKVNYFKQYTVAHHYLKEAYSQLIDLIRNPDDASVFLVYGPTGVGKTTLFKRVAKYFIESSLASLENDPGRMPIAGMEAAAPDTGNFDWKDHYLRCLKSLDEPLIEKKIDLERKRSGLSNDPARAWRISLENALKNRRPIAFMIDESQHLTKLTSGRKLRNQMDTIKSLASKSAVPHVLLGTYELLPFRNLSGQLTRRGTDVHFPRYRVEKAGDIDHFINTLWVFQKHLPFENEPSLVDDYDFFYKRSIGCIGILKSLLVKSLRRSLERNKKAFSMDICKSLAHTDEQCIYMIREAREGEALLEENRERHEELLRLLGIELDENQNDSKKTNKKKQKVGEQNPTRHAVGDLKNAQ
jgi:energy-coupling factor transporter ATP-binding protein EcfA2